MYCISAGVKNCLFVFVVVLFFLFSLSLRQKNTTQTLRRKKHTLLHSYTDGNHANAHRVEGHPSPSFMEILLNLLLMDMKTISKLITCVYKSMLYKSSSNQVQILRNLHHKAEGVYIQWKNLRQTLLASAAEIKHCLIRGALLCQNSTHMHSKSPKQIWVPLSILAFWFWLVLVLQHNCE